MTMLKRPPPIREEQGLTLVELMIALVLGLFVLAAAIALLLSSKTGYAAQDEEARLQDTGRYAIENISRAVRQTAYENWDTEEAPVLASSKLAAAIAGLDAHSLKAGTTALDAAVEKSVNGSDVLALRFFGSGEGGDGDSTMINCAGFGVPAPMSKDSAEQERGWSIYYVAKSASGDPQLYCKYRGKNDWTAQAIASGVESFQVLYGVDTDADGLANQLMTATSVDALDESLVLEGATAEEKAIDKNRKTHWKKVVLVRAALLIRGSEGVQTNAPDVTYDLFGEDYSNAHAAKDKGVRIKMADLPKADRNKARKIFASTIQIRNQTSGSGS